MLKNHFKIAIRKLHNHKAFTLISILGLTLGITCAILIFTLVKFHLDFDTFHTNVDRIYRITTKIHTETPGTPSPLGEAFRKDYDFAEKVTRIANFPNRLISVQSSNGHEKFEEDIAFAEPAFFDIFNFPLINGTAQFALGEPNQAIVTERIAKKYFGENNPIGKTITIDNRLNVTIAGILRNIPVNTDRREEIYLPFVNLNDHSPWLVEKDWWLSVNRSMQCFVLLKSNVSPEEVNEALSAISSKNYNEESNFQFKLQPIADIHFNTGIDGVISKKTIWILSLIGLFLIATGCINFINLSTARMLDHAKETSVRKVMGSTRKQIFWQFISETTLITLIAIGLSVVISILVLSQINHLFNTQLSIKILLNVHLLIFLIIVLIAVIFFSGSYPGLVLANLKPAPSLKSKISKSSSSSFSIRKGLVITQFTLSQLFIICTLVIASQMRYTRQAELGFQQEAIVMLPVPDNEKSRISALRSELSQISGIDNVTFCNYAPAAEIVPTTGIRFDSRPNAEKFYISLKAGDHHYVSMFGLQILEGRNLKPSDTIREFLINETTVKKLGIADNRDVIGKNADINGKTGIIVGVVKDFHNQSLHAPIDPIYITTQSDNYGSCAVKINLGSMGPALNAIKNIWSGVYPNNIYKYDFLDDRIARFYEADLLLFRLVQIFTFIAIAISCLGLYGLIMFVTNQKIKEIGIRKVNGAKVWEVMTMLNRDFIKWVLIAFMVASPIAWIAMNKWLENFAYKTELTWWIFALAGLLAMGIALLTVSWQSWKAATRNPVEALRYE